MTKQDRTILTLISAIMITAAITSISHSYADKAIEPVITMRYSPRGGCQEEVIKQINAAMKSIYVRAYGFTSEPIGAALCNAANRGVSVKILLDRSEKFNKHTQATACHRAGCDVRYDASHPIAHAKVIVVDSGISIFGSYNWTANAERNAEVMATVIDKKTAKSLIENFSDHWSDHGKPFIEKPE